MEHFLEGSTPLGLLKVKKKRGFVFVTGRNLSLKKEMIGS